MQFVSLKTNRNEVRHSAILHPLDLEKFNCQRGRKRVTIWQPNSFINPPKFAHHHFSKFPILIRIALILRPICVNLLKLLCHVSIILYLPNVRLENVYLFEFPADLRQVSFLCDICVICGR